jgi:Tfp pilus assembly protein PilF
MKDAAAVVSDLMAAGIGQHLDGHLSAALESYGRVVSIEPDRGEAWRLLGVVALQSGENAAAQRCLERAIRIDAADAAAHSALGSVHESGGDFGAAFAEYLNACSIDFGQIAALIGLIRVALRLDRAAEATAIVDRAIADGASDATLFRELGAARLAIGDDVGAEKISLASVRLAPHADAYANLALAYVRLRRIDAAIDACMAALALDPRHGEATNILGTARAHQMAIPQALEAFERAVSLGCETSHVGLGLTRLLIGDYLGGWPHYGWDSPERRANPAFAVLPMWDGSPAPEKRLLIWPEQGSGDTIQMVRFLGRARASVGSVTLACQPGTAELFRSLEGVDALIETSTVPELGGFDMWLPTIRLPLIFAVTADAIPSAPYLRADPARIERFRALLGTSAHRRIGLVWSGSPAHTQDRERSCRLADFAPLNDVPQIDWFALQQGVAREQRPQRGMRLGEINAHASNFADTAAIIAQLDLVITVDTSVAHLAGALGCPAWVLIAKRPDWRWGLTGADSLWYPSLRLFRQGSAATWGPVIAAVAAELRDVHALTR